MESHDLSHSEKIYTYRRSKRQRKALLLFIFLFIIILNLSFQNVLLKKLQKTLLMVKYWFLQLFWDGVRSLVKDS